MPHSFYPLYILHTAVVVPISAPNSYKSVSNQEISNLLPKQRQTTQLLSLPLPCSGMHVLLKQTRSWMHVDALRPAVSSMRVYLGNSVYGVSMGETQMNGSDGGIV